MGKKCRRRPCNRLSRWDSKKCRCVRGFKKCRGRKCKTKKCRGRKCKKKKCRGLKCKKKKCRGRKCKKKKCHGSKCKKKKCRGRYCKKKCRRRPCNRMSRWDSKKCRCVRGFKK